MASTTLALIAVLAVLLALHHKAQGARIIATLTNTSKNVTSQSPLVPGLVTTEPTVYKLSMVTWGIHYQAQLVMSGGTIANKPESDEDFAFEFKGEYSSQAFGHNMMLVTDPSTGKELFKVQASRHNFNPIEWVGRFSYRILPPGSKYDRDSIFTINKDYIGRGGRWGRQEWRIFRGRKRDKHRAYFCVMGYTFWADAKCYNSSDDLKDLSKLTPVLKLARNFRGDGGQFLIMQPEADAALFLAFGVILDATDYTHTRR